jgi:hypothetical protein
LASELSSIPGLMPKHVAVLTGALQISTAHQLAGADRRVIHAAMRRLRPAPTLAAISGWQDGARDLALAAADPPAQAGRVRPAGWEQAAAFVVSFEARQTSTDEDRRLVVEQVEQAPPEPRQEWPAWTPEAAWTWMLERAEPRAGTDIDPAPDRAPRRQALASSGRPKKSPAGQRRAAPASVREQARTPGSGCVQANAPVPDNAGIQGRIPRRIAAGTPELALQDGTVCRLDAGGPGVDVLPRAAIRVVPACEQGMRLHVGLRLRRAGAPSYAPSPPVTVVSGETAEIGLQDLPPGEHDAVLAIWASGGAGAAAVVPLPLLRVPE